MNWLLLLPSSPITIVQNLSPFTSQTFSDLWIYVNIVFSVVVSSFAISQTIVSFRKTQLYLNVINPNNAGVNLIVSSELPLFKILSKHLITIPSRDGKEQTWIGRSVDASEIFRDSELLPKFTRSRFYLSVPGLLTGWGVLGTFIGLQIGIGGLNLANLSNLDANIVPLIQGSAIAFSTSVWGVLTSLVFSALEKGLEGIAIDRIGKLGADIERLIPRYVPEFAMAELEKTSRGTEEILKGLAVAIGDQMQQAIGRLGQEVRDAIKDATFEGQGPLAEKSAELLANAITVELGNLKDQIGSMADQFSQQFTGASGELMASVRSFEPTVKTLSDTVTKAQQAVIEAVDKLSAHEAVMTQMADAANQMHLAAGAFSSMNQVLENTASSSERAANAQLSAASSNERVSDRFEDIGRNLPFVQETLKDAAEVIASISGPILELKSYLEKLPDIQQADHEKRTRSADERDRRMLDMTSDLAEKVALAAEQFGKVGPLADRLAEAVQNLDNASNELAIFGKQVLDASHNQKDASVASRAAAISGENAAKLLSPIPEKIEALNAVLQAAGSNLRTGAESARNSYKELITQQELWFKGAKIGLIALEDRLNQIIQSYGKQIEGQTKNLMSLWTNEVTQCLKTYQNQVSQLQGDLDALHTALDRLNRR